MRTLSMFLLTALTALLSWAAPASSAPRTCATCHRAIASRFAASAMGESIITPMSLPPGRVTHPESGTVMTTESTDNKTMVHTLSEQGLTAQFPIRYQIGGGLMGRTYMVQIGKTLFESPASWFKRYGWDVSPGYSHSRLLDFDRPMEQQCLFCHAAKANFDEDGRQLRQADLTAITCDRCHGSGESHMQRPSAQNIVNPAKLTGATRDSVCEQCHLEGVTRVLNPGKNWNDFHAGERTEQTFVTYLQTGAASNEIVAVSHAEQLAQSRCARNSGGKLWCGTCHNPHGSPADRVAQMKATCMSCHPTLSATAHPSAPAECTTCHMPRAATTDIAHAAITDHRILRRSMPVSTNPEGSSGRLVAWREPESSLVARDLALAQVVVGFSKNLPALGQEGFAALRALPSARLTKDGAALSALEGFALQEQNLPEALQLGESSIALQPQSAKAAMNYGIVLRRAGNNAEAEQQLKRAIDLDPSLRDAYIQLGMLYAGERRFEPLLQMMNRYLQWNPQDIMFNLQKARMASHP